MLEAWYFQVVHPSVRSLPSWPTNELTFHLCICPSVLLKVFWAPVLWTSCSWNLPVGMEGSLVLNFNNYYVLLIHVFDGCSNIFDPCDHFYPRPVMALGYCRCLRLSVCVSVCVCGNHELFRAITHHPFKLESPNLDQKIQNILLKIPIVLGTGWT